MKTISPPGIFNDAIGPVMRGPSSSHTAGSHRIGKILRQLAGSAVESVDFLFHPTGSLATTFETQGSDIGLAAGLLGMEITDSHMPEALKLARSQGLQIGFLIEDYPASHPNTYRCLLKTIHGKSLEVIALSTGGGLIELVEFEGFSFSRPMDLPTLFLTGTSQLISEVLQEYVTNPVLQSQIFRSEIIENKGASLLIIEFKAKNVILLKELKAGVESYFVDPVYPVLGYTGSTLPFSTAGELEQLDQLLREPLWKLAVEYESARSNIYPEEVIQRMDDLVEIFREAIDTGLSGTEYADRILGSQSPAFLDAFHKEQLVPAGPLSRMTAYTMAIMESKSAMEVIVAAPTAGAAGGLPGAIIGLAEEMKLDSKAITHAFLAAGLIGVFISREATFAAEVAGCQAETGVGAGMAAAGIIQLAQGSAKQALGAASIALQNVMGLICDPVGNRVEVPCLSRNVQAGANALSSANLILGGVDPVIPLSESIQTMLAVGKALPRELRCTALGGLAVTKTAKRIENRLKDLNQ